MWVRTTATLATRWVGISSRTTTFPRDEFGHGTHMAGIIAAQADNGIGIAGVAPAVRLMAVRAISGAGQGRSTIAAGIVYAADNGAQVITVSSGCVARCPSDPLVEQAVRHA